MSETPQANPGVADAVRGLSDNTAVLVRHEIAAVQREMLDKAMKALPAVGLLGAAGFFGVLSASASYRLSVRLLEKTLPPATAALVAAAGYGMAAGAAGTVGIQRLRASTPLVPAETVRQTVATVTNTAKTVAGTAAKTATGTATDTAKETAGAAKETAGAAAKKATDTVKATAGTTAKKAADSTKKAGSTTRAAASKASGKAAGPDQAGPDQPETAP